MIIVNNSGGPDMYEPFRHAAWNGITLADLVFPFFMFMMGVSMQFSLPKYGTKLNSKAVRKILSRTLLIFLIGVALDWFSYTCYHALDLSYFANMRVLGVMQRLALSYCGGAFLLFLLSSRFFLRCAYLILAIYAAIIWVGQGYVLSPNNILSRFDEAVLGAQHLYTRLTAPDGTSFPFDPEGLLSTLSCVPQVMFGMYVGRIIGQYKENIIRISHISIFGIGLFFFGFLLSYLMPLNKNIWSPTFVLVTCGIGSLLLAFLIWLIDIKHHTRWCRFFESFGINPLFMYVWAAVVATLFGCIRFYWAGELFSVKNFLYEIMLLPLFGSYPASLVYALLFVGFIWMFGYPLYRKKIYIKI